MRNLTNNINKINRKAENDKRKIDIRRYRAIGRAMAAQQDEIDKLNSLLHRMGIEMDSAMADPAAVDALHAIMMQRRDRAARAAEKRKKAAAERAAERAAAKKRPTEKRATSAAYEEMVRAMKERFNFDIE
jgi:hypothetical protein